MAEVTEVLEGRGVKGGALNQLLRQQYKFLAGCQATKSKVGWVEELMQWMDEGLAE